MKWKHILITTDLSDEATRAFNPAAALARESGARVTLLHVVPELLAVPHGAMLAPRMSSPSAQEERNSALIGLKKQSVKLGNGFRVDLEVTLGLDLSESIAEYAQEHDVDLVVMSTHGRSGLRRLVLGSIAEGVLRNSTVPVLCIPPEAQ